MGNSGLLMLSLLPPARFVLFGGGLRHTLARSLARSKERERTPGRRPSRRSLYACCSISRKIRSYPASPTFASALHRDLVPRSTLRQRFHPGHQPPCSPARAPSPTHLISRSRSHRPSLAHRIISELKALPHKSIEHSLFSVPFLVS